MLHPSNPLDLLQADVLPVLGTLELAEVLPVVFHEVTTQVLEFSFLLSHNPLPGCHLQLLAVCAWLLGEPFLLNVSPFLTILLYFLTSIMLQISNCTMCWRCLPVANFNEKKSSSVSSDDMAHCNNDLFCCKLLELKDHLWLKQLGRWNYADHKSVIAPLVPFSVC